MTITAAVSSINSTAGNTNAFTITRSQTGKDQTIYVQANGTATLGTDYTVTGSATANGSMVAVSFGGGDASRTVTITPTTGWMAQASETIQWQVVQDGPITGSASTYSPGSPSQASVTLQFVGPVVNVRHLAGNINNNAGSTQAFSVGRSLTGQAQTVNIQAAGTATLGTDYTLSGPVTVSGNVITVSFAAGDSTETLTVTPTNSWMAQMTETIQLQVLPASSGTASGNASAWPYIAGNSDSLNLTFVPDTVTIAPLISTLSELAGSTQAFRVSRSRTGQAQTVNVQLGGNASLGTDYTIDGYTATNNTIVVPFAAGDSSETVSITPTNDWMAQPNETIQLQVAGSSFPGNSTLTYTNGNPNQASLTLQGFYPTVTISVLVDNIFQTTGATPTFIITRSLTGKAQTVYVQAGGNAKLGSDYTVNNLSVLSNPNNTIAVPFAAGDSAETVTITPSTGSLSGSNLSIQWQVVQNGSITGGPQAYAIGNPNNVSVSLVGP